MVESEIIPRLMLAHQGAPAPEVEIVPTEALDAETTDAFADMVLAKDSESLIAFIGTLLQAGRPLDSIYMELLVPAARRLGDYWSADRATFTEVTIGLGRLQQVVRTLGWRLDQGGGDCQASRSALFAPAPGEQHTFGLFIVEDAFRRAGWRTWIEAGGDMAEVLPTVQCHWFDMVGLSMSAETQVERVATAIRSVREASRNPQIFVMLGGRLLDERPELVSLVGADATAASANDALLVADKAVRRLSTG
jgi:methanogenic corrinoid protein MtbC1